MEFGLLGPLVVRCGGAAVPIAAGRQRALLAALLLNANQLVSADQLTGVLWDQAPPPSARAGLHNQVKRLREALGEAGRERVCTRPGGYLMRVQPDELDLTRMRELLASARAAIRGDAWDQASALAAGAVLLWRGEPLAGVDSAVLASAIPGLTETCLQAAEIRLEAEVQLGRHAEVISDLRQLTADHPFREHAHTLLMLALYRSGRQGEALAAYQAARQVLVTELGCEPGPELQQMHQQILTGDPGLVRTDPATPPARLTASAPAPRQLPAAVAGFTGRAAELAALTQILDDAGAAGPGTVVISAIGGTAGVGKTALALHWAHRVADRFADGQLYVNLRGFDPSGVPTAPEAAIRGFLDALGVPPARLPASAEAQAGLYRSLLSAKRMLIVLDNARDEQQARPLLPASPASLVLITSRSQLGGLAAGDGARLLTLDVLDHNEAADMLTSRLGNDRAGAEPAAIGEIADLCACLPLALAVAAASAAARPGFPLSALAAELADSAGRLDALDAGDPAASVRAVFSWSYRQLSRQAARMFGLLGLHPGPDICVSAAASLAGIPRAVAFGLLRELARAHLMAEHLPGRYAFHDLLRAYAADQACTHDCAADRDAAVGRALDHYLHTAARAALLLDTAKEPVVLAPPRPGTIPEQPADHRQALAWFEAEHQALIAALGLAARSGFDGHAWQLSWAMASFLHLRGHWQEWAATQRTALAAATRLGDATGQALSGRLLGTASAALGDHDQARGHYARSLTLYQRLGNQAGEARVHQNLGVLAESQGRYLDALGHAEQTLRLFQAIGDKTAEAEALNNIGWYHGLLGDYQQARVFCRQALALSAQAGHQTLAGFAWDSLGYAEHHLGNLAEAAACYQRALNLHRESGDRASEADTLTHLGDTRQAVGEFERARQAWQQALAILESLQHPAADQVRAKLTSTTDHASPHC
jgi:DNA-binding SARP family transcriptional activator